MPSRFGEALAGGVAQPVQALEPRTIAEVEARHRIERAGRGSAVLPARRSAAARARILRSHSAFVMAVRQAGVVQQWRGRGSSPRTCWAPEPASEAGDRRQGDEGVEPRQVAASSSATCLIRKLPKEMPREPLLAVGDRVEDGGRAPSRHTACARSARSGRSLRECRRSAPPRRRSGARRRGRGGKRRSSAGRAGRCGGADRPSRGWHAPPRSG